MFTWIYQEFGRYPLFVIVGLLGLLLNLFLTYVMTEWLGWWYLWSFIFANIVTWTFGFFLNSVVTFRGHDREGLARAYLKFMFLYGFLSPPIFVLTYAFTSLWHIDYLISVVLINGISSVFTFFVNKRSIYKYFKT